MNLRKFLENLWFGVVNLFGEGRSVKGQQEPVDLIKGPVWDEGHCV